MGLFDALGGGLVSGSNMFDSFLHPEKGYEKAGQQLQKYYVDAQGKLQPIIEQGQAQYPRLNQQAEALNNPVNLENEWANSYTMSPFAQNLLGEAQESGLDAASKMGLMGSSAALNNIQKSAGNIMQSDRQQYLDDLMKKYMASIGIGQNIYGVGAGTAAQYGTNALGQGSNMAQVAYGRQNAPGEMFGKLLGTALNAGINYATGGLNPSTGAGMPAYAQNAIMGA